MRAWANVAGMVMVAMMGCGGGGTGPGDEMDGETVSLTADRLSLVPGQAAQITATITGGSATTATYVSSNQAVLTVNSSGAVTAHSAGEAMVTATAGSGTDNLAFTVVEGGLVTAAGATVTAYAGAVQLVVPSGAVSQETILFISLGSDLDPSSAVDGVIQVAPNAITFAQPATLRIRYEPAKAPRGVSRSGMGFRRLVNNAWVDVPGSGLTTEDAVQSTITTGGFYSAGRLVPTVPCTAPEDRAFDFWIGSWNVSVGSPRTVIATSEITMEPGGCAILEHYTDFGGTIGRSVNLRDANGMWHQTYVDNKGFRIGLTGSATGVNTITMLDAPGSTMFQRWSWIAEPGGTVRQVADATGNGGSTFGAPFWDGLYTRR